MRNMMRLLASAALSITAVAASPASAAVYDITYGTALSAEITTAPGTGTTQTITGITGTFLGSAITGLIGNPYSPAAGYYFDSTQQVQATSAVPNGLGGIQYYYNFNNLLLAGNGFDNNGLLFQTTSNVANLFANGTTQLVYSAIGSNVAASSLNGTYAISAVAAVPEPASWAMMIVGMGAVGFAMRNAKRRSEDKFDAKIKKITYRAIA